VPGDRTAAGRVGFDRAWIVVLITAAITASPGLAVGRPLTGIPRWRPLPRWPVMPRR
jgi:hypothetical protein